MKVLIVGGVAGGATAAARLRRINEEAEIIIFERGEFISFANCGLPYHISGVIADRDSLLVQTPEGFRDRFKVDVRVKNEILSINREKKEVSVYDIKAGKEYRESYDYLILSPGAEPFKPNIKGIESKRIFTLRSIPDMDNIIKSIKEDNPMRAVVIGGGFIGIEVAENLLEKNIKVTIVEAANQILAPLDYEMAAIIHSHIKEKEIELYLNDGVDFFEDKEDHTLVYLKSGKRIQTDMIIMAIGVKPEIKLAKDAELEIGERNGIVVDEFLSTKDKFIYAVGDAIEVKHWINGEKTLIPLAWPANRQGRIVADNIVFGNKEKYKGTLGTSILKAFDLTAAATGLNEKNLKRLGLDYEKIIIHSSSHASYYPGASPISIKLLFDKTGKIYGAQAVGLDGADKRIDVLATAIKANMKVYDLPDLELAYAPPFGSAKDPVNMAGYVASNVLKGDMKIIHWDEIDKLDQNKTILLDVRTKYEFSVGTIKNAINIDLNTLRDNLDKLDKNKEIIIFCRVGLRGYLAYKILVQNGFKVRNLTGGYNTYSYAVDKQSNPDIFDYEQIKMLKDVDVTGDNKKKTSSNTYELDARGLQCPGPIMKTYKKIEELENGDLLKILSSDTGFAKDVKTWAEKTNNLVVDITIDKGTVNATLQKGNSKITKKDNKLADISKDNKTIVVFSNDLDKAMASFIIANGALAMGKKVTLFFTFWGLSLLRKENSNYKGNKNFMEKMFSKMLPKGANKLNSLSKMNMSGLGAVAMKKVMKDKNVESINFLLESLIENGAKLIACTMSMDVMGISEEELIDGVELGGVGAYLGEAEDSNLNLFI